MRIVVTLLLYLIASSGYTQEHSFGFEENGGVVLLASNMLN